MKSGADAGADAGVGAGVGAGTGVGASVSVRFRRAVRWPAATCYRGALWLTMQAHGVAGLARVGRCYIRATHPGDVRVHDGGKAAVFAHFDPDGVVHDYVLHHLAALRDAGFATIFVSNAPQLTPDALARLRPLVARVIHRWNVGYDFAAYKDGLAVLGAPGRLDQVVLANDSVYGPLFDLTSLLRRCDAQADVWGMTDNQDHGYHLQSYFLLFNRLALDSPALAAFWRGVRPVQSRQWVIRRYEIGLTAALRRAGLRCAALFPYEAVLDGAGAMRDAGSGAPINVMHMCWERLVAAMGCPFIKRELLMYNPLKVPGIARWPDVVRRVSRYDTDLIARHLRTRGAAHRA